MWSVSFIIGRLLWLSLLLCLGLCRAQGQETFSKFYEYESSVLQGFTDIAELDSAYLLVGSGRDSTLSRQIIFLSLVHHNGTLLKQRTVRNDTISIAAERLGKIVKCGEYWYVACMGVTSGLGPSAGLILAIDDTLGMHREIFLDHEPQEELLGLTCWRNQYIYAAGYSRPSFLESQDLWFVQLDTAGNVLRDTTIGQNVFEITVGIDTLTGGRLITAPARNDYFVDGKWNLVIMTLDTALSVLSEVTHTGPGEYCAGLIYTTFDGSVAMIGCYDTMIVPSEFDFSYFLSKINGSGDFIWKHYLGYYEFHTFSNIIETNNNDLVSVGFFNHPRQDTVNAIRAHIISVDSSGNRNWYREYYAPANYDYNSELYDVIQTADGGYLACGRNIRINGQARAWLLKLDSIGCLIPGCDTLGMGIGLPPVQLSLDDNLQVYPNPASDQLHLLWRVDPQQATEITTYQLIGLDGRVALRGEIPQTNGRVLLRVGNLSPGMYTVLLQHGEDRFSRQKVVVGR